MFNSGAMPSLADIAAVTGNNNGNGDGLGNGNGWWVLIILFALFGGWGRGGYGNGDNANGGSNVTIIPVPTCSSGFGGGWGAFDASSAQRGFDTQQITNKLNGIENGICSLGYDQLNQMNGINSTIMQTGFGLQQAVNGVGQQVSNCCCDLRSELKDIMYNMATDTCAIKNEVHQTGDNIVNTMNWNARNLSDEIRSGFAQLERQGYLDKISSLEAQLNTANRDAALQGTASYIINAVSPRSQPAYLTCNPATGSVFPNMGCNPIPVQQVNDGCGCNRNYGCCNG